MTYLTKDGIKNCELTLREWEVHDLICKALTDRAIGIALGITVLTAKTHVSNICIKLNCRSRTEVIVRAKDAEIQRLKIIIARAGL